MTIYREFIFCDFYWREVNKYLLDLDKDLADLGETVSFLVILKKRLDRLSASIWTRKSHMKKFNRTTIYGLPIYASVLSGHKFHFTFT